MGSGFVPSGIYGGKLGAMAGILAETAAYADFVGDTVAADGAAGMYFYGIDRRDLAANNETFPSAFVIWSWGDDFEKFSTQAGGTEFQFRGSVTLTIEANTPEEFLRNTPGAHNWLMEHMQAMVRGMELLWGWQGRQGVGAHRVVDLPFREVESGVSDYCCMTVAFTLRD